MQLSHAYTAGVSGASVVELKAELYRAQQDAKLAQEGLLDEELTDRKKAGIDVSGILGRRNAGVEQRSAKDDLSYKVRACHELQQWCSRWVTELIASLNNNLQLLLLLTTCQVLISCSVCSC